jgi:hypothetical protein
MKLPACEAARRYRATFELAPMGINTVPLHFEHCDLLHLCRQAAGEQMATSGRPVTLDLPGEPVELEADGARIGQVLSNLLSNALKYSPTQAPVELRCGVSLMRQLSPYATKAQVSHRRPSRTCSSASTVCRGCACNMAPP